MKKITAIMLVAIMMLCLVGCSGDDADSVKTINSFEFFAAFRNKGYKVTEGTTSAWNPKLFGIQEWKSYDYAYLYIREADVEKAGECFYFEFESDQDAKTAYIQIKDTVKTGMNVQDVSISNGKKCYVTKKETNTGEIYVISQVGNTVLLAFEQWVIEQGSNETYDDAIKKIFTSLGY